MSYEDRRFDLIRKLLDIALIDKELNRANRAYKRMKKLQLNYCSRYPHPKINDQDEVVNLTILELMTSYDFGSEDETHIESSEELARILKFDYGLRKYCEEMINKDGVIGKLKYDIQIYDKKDLIKDALELTKI